MLRNLNEINGAATILEQIHIKVLEEFKKDIIGVEMGIAWAGGIEAIAKLWKDNGIVYGFDTFEGHPRFLAKQDETCGFSENSFAAKCMDDWYKSWGYDECKEEYIREKLDEQGLNNVILCKGLITQETNIDFIPYINYALLDLDFPISMKSAYSIIKDKMVPNSYLCLHDVVPHGHINGLNEFYTQVILSDGYEIISETPQSYLAVLKKRS
jgi:hypothetical protein